MHLFLLHNTEEDIVKNNEVRTTLPIDFYCMENKTDIFYNTSLCSTEVIRIRNDMKVFK